MKFNEQLIEQLNEQENYIKKRMDKRDQLLMQSLKESQETKKLLLTAQEEQLNKRKGLFKFFNKN